MSLKQYRALTACIVGGVYRHPGDVFEHQAFKKTPEHLIEFDQQNDQPDKAPEWLGPSLQDLGIGEPINSADLTLVDMIKKG